MKGVSDGSFSRGRGGDGFSGVLLVNVDMPAGESAIAVSAVMRSRPRRPAPRLRPSCLARTGRDRPPGLPAAIGAPPTERSRSRIMLMAAAGALALAAIAVIAIILFNSSRTSAPSQTSSYSQKLGSALAPVVSANQSLSGALQAIDRFKKDDRGCPERDLAGSVRSHRGAGSGQCSDRTEFGHVGFAAGSGGSDRGERLSTGACLNLSAPASQSSSQLRPLITAAQSAMVPLAQVAPGATSSLGGVDNVLSWVAGATVASQAAKHKAQQQTSSPAKASQPQA